MTVKFCNRLTLGTPRLTRIMLGLISPGSAKADVGWDGN